MFMSAVFIVIDVNYTENYSFINWYFLAGLNGPALYVRLVNESVTHTLTGSCTETEKRKSRCYNLEI